MNCSLVSGNLFGIINVNKPVKFTSHDVVSKLRKILNIRQIGHTGTLDPLAVGVLPVCIGKATRIIQYLEGSKAYRAYVKLGIRTNTYDADGEIIEDNPVNLDLQRIQDALKEFQGEITQKPPIYSAVHYKGKRLYEYARANIEVEDIPERNVHINSIELLDILNKDSDHPTLIVDIDCSGGTYIRSIANDLGDILGYGASLDSLIRTKSGRFTIDKSHSLEEIQEFFRSGRLNEILINPVDVINLERVSITEDQINKVTKGQYIKICDENKLANIEKIQLIYENKLIAIARIEEDKAFPINVFV
ncbi:MAG: tRNA pseudouridine(55) synthase TruB [Candidatus Melainabacteria bacterium RIFOXYA2_FULL_32_9]|nr:MAG: tRNA pseudouridine(55) synthase TruB [Candidatus Melainabacteria bacterium RIFOXYA2_FULL_32_9]